MAVIGLVLRIYSYLYHLLLALFLTGLAMVAFLTGQHSLKLDMLPWSGKSLTWWLIGLAVTGILSILLAWTGTLPLLFPLYALVVFGLMVRGYFLSGYTFHGADEFSFAIYLTAGALVAVLGAWSVARKRKSVRGIKRASGVPI